MSMVFKYKVIKPKRLKDKNMRLELLNGIRKVARGVTKDFEETVKTWERKPKFEQIISLKGAGPQFLVGTDDEVYGYVNSGTRAHNIFPKRAKALRFLGTYRAKTSPGVIGSGAGGSSGDEVFSQGVRHPGTKARKFDEMISKKWDRAWRNQMIEAMRQAAKKSGNEYP